jgi:hypothetical protein
VEASLRRIDMEKLPTEVDRARPQVGGDHAARPALKRSRAGGFAHQAEAEVGVADAGAIGVKIRIVVFGGSGYA